MDAYPKLSREAYADDVVHRREVIEQIAAVAADMCRYYRQSLTETQIEQLIKALDDVLPGGK